MEGTPSGVFETVWDLGVTAMSRDRVLLAFDAWGLGIVNVGYGHYHSTTHRHFSAENVSTAPMEKVGR